jgi:hypothetical protein
VQDANTAVAEAASVKAMISFFMFTPQNGIWSKSSAGFALRVGSEL